MKKKYKTACLSYFYEVLKPSVVLQLIFVVADSFSVVTAEISITFLHLLSYFTRELKREKKISFTTKQFVHGNMLILLLFPYV